MRSLTNVIKVSQYNTIVDSIPVQKSAACQASTDEQSKTVLNEAFQKAKEIMEAAKTYSMNQVKEATERMNEECVKAKLQSHNEGYAIGLLEGKNAGKSIGYKEGYEEGLKKAKQENQSVLNELTSLLQQVETKKAEILSTYENDLIQLATAIAKKIIQKELVSDEQTILSIIKNAEDSYHNQAWVRITVSNKMAEILLKTDGSLAKAMQDISMNVKIISSPDMADGDCVIEMPDQVIDAGVTTQLNNISKAFSNC